MANFTNGLACLRRRQRAFTMVELMVVLVALGILVAMVVGLGSNIADEQNRAKTQTTQRLIIGALETFHNVEGSYPEQLHHCVEYTDVNGDVIGHCHEPPFIETESSDDENNYGIWPHSNEYWRMMTLTLRLGTLPDCTEIFLHADGFAMDQRYAGLMVVGVFNDAYGRCMDWDLDGGFGGSPAIISNGVDGYFGHYTPHDSGRPCKKCVQPSGGIPLTIEASEALFNREFEEDTDLYLDLTEDGTNQLDYQEDNIRSDGRSWK